jgi:hypothetical protein
MKGLGVFGIIIGAIALIFLISLILSYPVMWLWNSTMPELFHLQEIGVWMAWKLAFLCGILFKSYNYSPSK